MTDKKEHFVVKKQTFKKEQTEHCYVVDYDPEELFFMIQNYDPEQFHENTKTKEHIRYEIKKLTMLYHVM